MASSTTYWNKMGTNGHNNFLFAINRRQVHHIEWQQRGAAVDVLQIHRYMGVVEGLTSRGYARIEEESAAKILLAAIGELTAILPTAHTS